MLPITIKYRDFAVTVWISTELIQMALDWWR
ncbi:hypothetical protein OKW20_000875 [Ensifer sp. LBL]